jgi:hypothetical protein
MGLSIKRFKYGLGILFSSVNSQAVPPLGCPLLRGPAQDNCIHDDRSGHGESDQYSLVSVQGQLPNFVLQTFDFSFNGSHKLLGTLILHCEGYWAAAHLRERCPAERSPRFNMSTSTAAKRISEGGTGTRPVSTKKRPPTYVVGIWRGVACQLCNFGPDNERVCLSSRKKRTRVSFPPGSSRAGG